VDRRLPAVHLLFFSLLLLLLEFRLIYFRSYYFPPEIDAASERMLRRCSTRAIKLQQNSPAGWIREEEMIDECLTNVLCLVEDEEPRPREEADR